MKRKSGLILLLILSLTFALILSSCNKTPDTKVERIEFECGSVTMRVGDVYVASVTIYPEGAEGELLWSSSNETVITVQSGSLTAAGVGEATVTVSLKDNEDVAANLSVSVIAADEECSHIPADEPTITNVKPADCKSDGSYVAQIRCTICGDLLSSETLTVESKGYHNYVNGRCTGCGSTMSAGLEYTLTSDCEDTFYTVTGIGGCTDKNVVIPDNVDGIPVCAVSFGDSEIPHVKSIHIPHTVSVFSAESNICLSGLTAYTVDENSPYYKARDGVLYGTKSSTVLWAYPPAKALTEFTVPRDVTEICEYAFSFNLYLESVNIGSGTLKIGRYAFYRAERLAFTDTGDGARDIGSSAFGGCVNLISVRLGQNISSVEEDAFEGCIKLSEVINDSLLTVITDPLGTGYVIDTALSVHTGSSIIENYNGLFFLNDGTDNILIGYAAYGEPLLVLPDSYKGSSYIIGKYAFFGHTEIVSVTVGSGVKEIRDGAFESSYAIAEVVNRSSLEISKDTPTAHGNVAYSAKLVTDVSTVEDYQNFLFLTHAGVNYLLSFTGDGIAVELPGYFYDENYVINSYAFASRRELERIVIGDGVTEIGDHAFFKCTSLCEVMIPEGVSVIGASAFERTSLSRISVPDSVSLIGDKAFYSNCVLEEIYVGSGVSLIGTDALSMCPNLRTVDVTVVNKTYRSSGNVIYTKDGKTLVFYSQGLTAESFTLSGMTENVASGAFAYNKHLKSIVIGEGIKNVGDEAFLACKSLESVKWLAVGTVIGNGAFSGCDSLLHISFVGGETEWRALYEGTVGNEILGTVEVEYNSTAD